MNMKMTSMSAGVAVTLFAAGATAATVSVIPSVSSVAAGGTFTSSIVADFTDLGGFNDGGFNLSWDTNLITMVPGSNVIGSDLQSAFDDFAILHPLITKFPFESNVILGIGSLEFSFTNCGLDITLPGNVCEVIGDTASVVLYQMDFTLTEDTTIAVGPALDPTIGADWRKDDQLLTPDYVSSTVTVSPIPVPAAVWLFGSGLLGMIGIARRRNPQLA